MASSRLRKPEDRQWPDLCRINTDCQIEDCERIMLTGLLLLLQTIIVLLITNCVSLLLCYSLIISVYIVSSANGWTQYFSMLFTRRPALQKLIILQKVAVPRSDEFMIFLWFLNRGLFSTSSDHITHLSIPLIFVICISSNSIKRNCCLLLHWTSQVCPLLKILTRRFTYIFFLNYFPRKFVFCAVSINCLLYRGELTLYMSFSHAIMLLFYLSCTGVITSSRACL